MWHLTLESFSQVPTNERYIRFGVLVDAPSCGVKCKTCSNSPDLVLKHDSGEGWPNSKFDLYTQFKSRYPFFFKVKVTWNLHNFTFLFIIHLTFLHREARRSTAAPGVPPSRWPTTASYDASTAPWHDLPGAGIPPIHGFRRIFLMGTLPETNIAHENPHVSL